MEIQLPTLQKIFLLFFINPALSQEDYDGKKGYNPTLLVLMKHTVQPNVAGGLLGKPYSFPWLAAIYRYNNFDRAGSIISDRFIITSSKDLDPTDMDAYSVILGENNLACHEGFEQVLAVKEIHFSTKNADRVRVALLELQKPIDFALGKGYITPIVITTSIHSIGPVVDKAMLVGFGRTAEKDPMAMGVREVTLTPRDQKECDASYSSKNIDDMVCYGGVDGKGGCSGDEGGPLLCYAGMRYMCGIAVETRSCGKDGQPDLFINTIPYEGWIRKITHQDAPEDPYPAKTVEIEGSLGETGVYIQGSSVQVRVHNIQPDKVFFILLKIKYTLSRVRMVNASFEPGDKVIVSRLCKDCNETYIEWLDRDYFVNDYSLILIKIKTTANTANNDQLRYLDIVVFSKGYMDDVFTPTTALFRQGTYGQIRYPEFGGMYRNNEDVIYLLEPGQSAEPYLDTFFTRFDLKTTDESLCNQDFLEVYSADYRDPVDVGIYRFRDKCCGFTCRIFTIPRDLTWFHFKSNDAGVGAGFEFAFGAEPTG